MKSIRGLSVLQGRDAGPSTALPAVAPVGMTNRRSQIRSPDARRSFGMTKRETVAPVGMTKRRSQMQVPPLRRPAMRDGSGRDDKSRNGRSGRDDKSI